MKKIEGLNTNGALQYVDYLPVLTRATSVPRPNVPGECCIECTLKHEDGGCATLNDRYYDDRIDDYPDLNVWRFTPIWPTPDAHHVMVLSKYYGSYNEPHGALYQNHVITGNLNGAILGAMDIKHINGNTVSVYAVADGYVRYANPFPYNNGIPGPDGAGWVIVLDHGGGIASYYSHLGTETQNTFTNNVIINGFVAQNEQIATMGSTGHSYGNHLHFEIYKNYNYQTDSIRGAAVAAWLYFRNLEFEHITYDRDIVYGCSPSDCSYPGHYGANRRAANPPEWRNWIAGIRDNHLMNDQSTFHRENNPIIEVNDEERVNGISHIYNTDKYELFAYEGAAGSNNVEYRYRCRISDYNRSAPRCQRHRYDYLDLPRQRFRLEHTPTNTT